MDSWPTWARELNLDTKWAESVETLEVDGCAFLVVSRYGLDRSATIALVGDACEQIQVLIWNDSDGRVSG